MKRQIGQAVWEVGGAGRNTAVCLVKVTGYQGHRDGSDFHCLLMVGEKVSQKKEQVNWASMHDEGVFRQARMEKAFQAE